MNYHKRLREEARKNSFFIVVIGTALILSSLTLNSLTQTQNVYAFIIMKYLLLFLVPTFYFGYKSQNQTDEVHMITKMNPVFSYFYNKSLSELRENEKSAEIIKRFLQTHKEDIRKSLFNSAGFFFFCIIKNVIINDYDRLETLLAYNNVTTKSKVAIIDYTMEVFSTFLINLEVNLQDIYTEHLLKSSPENLHNPIGNDFIESKFSKLFSQWESLDSSTQ